MQISTTGKPGSQLIRIAEESKPISNSDLKILQANGIKSGFDKDIRKRAYLKMLFRQRGPESRIQSIIDKVEKDDDDDDEFKKVKDYDVIDKDAIRSMFQDVTEEDGLRGRQKQLGKMLKSVFLVYNDGGYYQGLNEIMSILLLEYGILDSLQLFEGLLVNHFW